jgi:arylsulfatase A-like enzyme
VTLAETLRDAGFETGAFTGGAHMERVWGFDQASRRSRSATGPSWDARASGSIIIAIGASSSSSTPIRCTTRTRRRSRWFDQFEHGYRQGPLRDVVRQLRAEAHEHWDDAHRRFWNAVDKHEPASVRFVERLYDAGIRHMDATTLTESPRRPGPLRPRREYAGRLHVRPPAKRFSSTTVFLHDDLHHETLHVPLVVRFPGHVPAGGRVAPRRASST